MKSDVSLGSVVRDRRLALGYSLGQLATKVNKTASSIRAWERGERAPSPEEAEALAMALDLDAQMLTSLIVEPVARPQPEPEPAPRSSAALTAAEIAADEEEAVSDEPAPLDVPAEPMPSDDVSLPIATVDEPVGAIMEPVAEPLQAAATPAVEEEAEAMADRSGVRRPEPVAPTPAADTVGLQEALTEAVPVVATAAVTVAPTPRTTPPAAARDMGSRNPVLAQWDAAVDWYRRIFDPRRKWIYRVRIVLLLIAFYIMLKVLAWAVGGLWDAIQQVLDSISFSPTDTPDVST